MIGLPIPFFRNMPAGLIPAAFAGEGLNFVIPGKDGLGVLDDRPLNAETPPHLLDDPITPTERHSVRSHGITPEDVDPANWKLTVEARWRRHSNSRSTI